jgi:transcriptional regulator with XRE-family HTH domain
MAGSTRKTFRKNTFYRDLGNAIRLARVTAGKTMEEAAEEIGVSYQQIYKYEAGANRLPVEQLVALAAYLKAPIPLLLDLPAREPDLLSLSDRLHANGFHTLPEAWSKIKDQPMRTAILNLAKCAAQ